VTGWARALGRTGLTVSAVCAGGAPLGSMPKAFGYEVSREQGVAVVRAVLDSPIRWIDTSNGYSDGESERRIGEAVAAAGGLPPDFLVATKVDARAGDYSGERVRASVRESKERLGLDALPLVYLHDPEFHDFDDLSAPGGAVETLMRLREAGEIGHVGLAGGDVHTLRRYLELGGFEVLLVHNRWTLVDHSAGELIDRARDDGIAIVNAAIYGGGILAGSASRDYGYRPATPATLAAIDAMRAACAEAGTDLPTAALQASVRDPRVDATVVGFSKPERVASIVAAAGAEPPSGLLERLAELLPARANWLDFQGA
jgi:D-threo-aldose 1-dehydrogenase